VKISYITESERVDVASHGHFLPRELLGRHVRGRVLGSSALLRADGDPIVLASVSTIDDVLVGRGRVGFHTTLRWTIGRGLGAGERTTAAATCSFVSFTCRMVAESFSAGTSALIASAAVRFAHEPDRVDASAQLVRRLRSLCLHLLWD
jgi:hypothetical protein